jgi:hypothetical protein
MPLTWLMNFDFQKIDFAGFRGRTGPSLRPNRANESGTGESVALRRVALRSGHFETHAALPTPPGSSSMNPRRRWGDTRWMILTLEPRVGAPHRSDLLPLKRDGLRSNRHRALAYCLRMIFSEKPLHTFPDHALGRGYGCAHRLHRRTRALGAPPSVSRARDFHRPCIKARGQIGRGLADHARRCGAMRRQAC